MNARLEHANITVADPEAFAELLCRLFDWKVRWSGPALDGGRTVHVGDEDTYLALYTHDEVVETAEARYAATPSLNHIGVVVKDLEQVERRVTDNGLVSGNHQDYEPGKRFYIETPFAVEVEVISYQ